MLPNKTFIRAKIMLSEYSNSTFGVVYFPAKPENKQPKASHVEDGGFILFFCLDAKEPTERSELMSAIKINYDANKKSRL